MINVLITGVGSSNSISLIKGLRKQNTYKLKIIGIDINKESLTSGSHLCDVFYTVPRADNPEYISKLKNICEKETVNILIPVIDEEFEIISKNRTIIEELGINIILSNEFILSVCMNKWNTFKYLKKNNIPTPETWDSKNEILYFPCIRKPISGRGSRDIAVYKDPGEIRNEDDDKFIYQQFIEGNEYTVDTFSDENGSVYACVPRLRIETKSGVSTKAKIVANKKIENYSIQICENLKIKGPACIQFIEQNENIYVIEINPRVGSALPITIEAGVNIPKMIIDLVQNKKIQNCLNKYKENIVMLRYWEEIFTTDD